MGTANVLDALRGQDGVRAVVVVTTDKVYENREQPYPYRESDALGGHDPYSASKAAAELVAASYRDAFLAERRASRVATARAGNVIGGGDWSEDRLIPDAVRAWSAGRDAAACGGRRRCGPGSTCSSRSPATCVWPSGSGTSRRSRAPTTSARTRTRPRPSARWSTLARAAYGARRLGTAATAPEGPHEAGRLALETRARRASRSASTPRWSLAEARRADDALVPRQRRRRIGMRAVLWPTSPTSTRHGRAGLQAHDARFAIDGDAARRR